MTVNLYTPLFLDREKTNFKIEKGNYQIDYRSKGDDDSASALTVLNVPFSKIDSPFSNYSLDVIPLEISSSGHPSGINENFGSYNVDQLITSELSDEIGVVLFVSQEFFSVEFNSAKIIEVEEDISEEESILVKRIDITFNILEYFGENNNKNLFQLFNSNSKPYMFLGSNNIEVVKGLVDSSTFNIYSYFLEEYTTTPYNVENTMISDLTTLRVNLNIDYKPEWNSLPLDTEINLNDIPEDLKNVKHIFLEESEPTFRNNITIVSTCFKSGNEWLTTNPNILSSSITNFKDANQSDLENEKNIIGFYYLIEKNKGVYFNVSQTALKDSFIINQSLIPKKVIMYNVEADSNLAETYSYITSTDFNQNLDVIVYEDGETLDSFTTTLNNFSNLNSSLLKYGIGLTISNNNYLFYTLKDNLSIELRTNTNTVNIPFTVNQITDYGLEIPDLKLSLGTTIYDTGNEFINTIFLTNKNNLFLNSFKIKETNDTIPSEVIVKFNETEVLKVVPSSPSSVRSNQIRRVLKLFKSELSSFNIQILPKVNSDIFIRNLDDKNSLIGISEIFLKHPVDPVFTNNFEDIKDNIYYVSLGENSNESYNSFEDLDGSPIVIQVNNLSVITDRYLKIDISSNPDFNLIINGTVNDSSTSDINVLVEKINKVIRSQGVLCNIYDEDSLIFYKVTEGSTVLDFYLYNTLTPTTNMIAQDHITTSIDLFHNFSTEGNLYINDNIDSENTSSDFWYYEDDNRQPILFKGKESYLNKYFNFQINPSSSDTVLQFKIENNFNLFTYVVVNVPLPAYELYTDNNNLYYETLRTNLSTALTTVLGSNSNIVLTVETNTYQTYRTGITLDNLSIRIENTGYNLRQFKIASPNDSRIFEVSTTGKYATGVEYENANIFNEFTGITNAISFWMR